MIQVRGYQVHQTDTLAITNMAANTITYTDKEQGRDLPNIADINKYTFTDANEVKTVVNQHATEIDGKLPLSGGTMTGAIDGNQSARLYRPQSESSLTADSNLSDLEENTTILVNTTSSDVTITVDDTANNLPIGTTFEFIHRVGGNDVVFTISGSQSILSADDYLKIRVRFAAAILTKQLNNTWYLIGDLKA